LTTRETSAAALVTLIPAKTYEPFGALKTATYGNTLSLTQSWGQSLAAELQHDTDDKMIAITDAVVPSNLTVVQSAFD
jgi:hypothetical protein